MANSRMVFITKHIEHVLGNSCAEHTNGVWQSRARLSLMLIRIRPRAFISGVKAKMLRLCLTHTMPILPTLPPARHSCRACCEHQESECTCSPRIMFDTLVACLRHRSRWWEHLAAPIVGGQTVTDLPSRWIVYPSNPDPTGKGAHRQLASIPLPI